MRTREREPLGFLATVAITVGVVALGAYVFDWHAHQCEACGTRWRHLGAFNIGDPGAHACGKCGTVQWWKDGVPHVFRDVLRQPPPEVLPDTRVSRMQGIRSAPHLALSAATAVAWPLEGRK